MVSTRGLSQPVCFAAGTTILLADGTNKAIDEIEVGEMVLAAADRDPEGPVEPRRVVEVYHNRPDQVMRLQVGELTIRPTLKHPFYVKHKGWTAAGELKVGDELRTHDGRWTQLTATEDRNETEPVYNLHVEGYHTYFVGNTSVASAVLVHNDSESSESSVTVATSASCVG